MSTKTPKQEEGENDWFFDIIINFLRSPRWKAPIMSFLDEHCIIFDNEDENKLEYTPCHNEFKKLVEELIGELLAELGVTQEQFMAACQKAESNPIHKKIVDQIVAVENFMAFKKLMCKRNAELNSQAMKMLQKQQQALKEEDEKDQKELGTPKTDPEAAKKKTDELLLEQQKKAKSKGIDKEFAEALRVAQEAERAEEEELMKKALEESKLIEQRQKEEEEEEMKLIQQAIEMSRREEEERKAKEGQASSDPQNEVIQAKSSTVTTTTQSSESSAAKIELTTVTGGPAMTEAELKKLEQLRALKK